MKDKYKVKFQVTEDHLKLLRNMYVRWQECENGAPAINCKRPYGNSDVESDVCRILERYLSDEEAFKIHKETETVLQITLHVGYFKPGIYGITEAYRNDWELIE
jgi:hypothetical protein